ncbi:unnamed protein product [Ectocarpus fasciculatus]
MEKSKLEVIQDDILAVKHALANNIAYEGLHGDQLTTVLSTLFSQRAQQTVAAAAAAATTSGGSGGSEPASFAAAAAASPQGNGATGTSRVPVNGSRAKAVSAKKKSPKKPTSTTTPATTSDPANDDQSTPTAASTDTPKTQTEQTKDKEATPNKKAPPPKSKPPKRKHKPAPSPAQQKEKPAAKKRKKSLGEVLRELRKSIKVGDFVSVLGDVLVRGTWEKVWIKGEVVREMNRSGIFQIAFDHDRQGQKSAVKKEPGSHGVDERWIHEQRLSIEHPDFFCGQGDSPPIGIDHLRPKGAWYLHQGQVVSPPDMCSRTPRLSDRSGSGDHSSSSTDSSSSVGSSSSSPATATAAATAPQPAPQPAPPVSDPVAWNQSSLGSDSVHGASSVAAAAGQSGAAVSPASGFLDL